MTIDLHGLQIAPAIEFLEEKIEKLKSDGNHGPLLVIYGAGNHSDKDGPKIKPAVRTWLDEHQYKWEEVNNGSVNVSL